MRSRVVVALMLISASLGAIAVDAQREVNPEPTALKESECYLCHSEGGGSLGPALPLLYLIHGPENLEVPVEEKTTLEVGVENAWVSELNTIVGIADLSNAPCLGFASDKDSILDSVTGEIPATVTAMERTDRTTFQVVAGATDLVVTLQRDPNAGTEADPDWVLRLWPPGSNPDNTAPISVNDNGPGEPEVYEVHGAQEIAELGVGEWTAEMVVPPAGPGNPGGATDQSYELTTFLDFRSTGEDTQFTGTSDVLQSRVEEPGKLAYLSWTITAECVPDAPTTLPVEVILIAYYDHGSTQISQWDEWRFSKSIELQVIPQRDPDVVIIRANSVAEIPQVKDAFAWDIFSEILGYVSAVLIIASIYTGGMFGKVTRRQLNSLFGTAKRRVAFHNFLSYAILLAALAHTIVFLFENAYDWTLGIIWGGIAILAMIGLGVTGALQVPMIRKWNYAVWRWSHFYLSIGTIVFTVVHILLDGAHFVDLQESIGWSNPFTNV